MKDYTSPMWTSSALLTVDVQREFSTPQGGMLIPGNAGDHTGYGSRK